MSPQDRDPDASAAAGGEPVAATAASGQSSPPAPVGGPDDNLGRTVDQNPTTGAQWRDSGPAESDLNPPDGEFGPSPARQEQSPTASEPRPWASPDLTAPWPQLPTGLEPPPDTSHLLPAPTTPGGEVLPVLQHDEVFALERESDAKRVRKVRTGYEVALAAVIMLSSLALGLGLASSGSVLMGVIMGLVLFSGLGAGLAGLVLGLRRQVRFNPMPNALASHGPQASGQIYSNADPDEIWRAIASNVSMTGMQVERNDDHRMTIRRPGGPQNGPFHLLVDLRPAAGRPGWQLVSVLARPNLPLVYSDGGAAQRLADTVLRSVPGRDLNPPAIDAFTSE